MKKTMLACALMAATFSVAAKDKLIPLADADAALLKDKTVALTVHPRPSFSAMTAGKASFGLLGAAAMISAGNKLVDENHVQDPAEILRANLSAALHDIHGVTVLAPDTAPTKASKPKELAALHPEADYVLDVRSGGWMYAYYPTKWGTYWVGYSVQVQLVDTKTGRQVSNAACNAHTRDNANPPSLDQLHADQAKLLKAVTTSLGWTCVQTLAKDQFHFAPEQVAAIPAEYVNPLAGIQTPVATDTASAAMPTDAAAAAAPAADTAVKSEGASAPATADGAATGNDGTR
ncbi:hypothetical protein J2X04_003098 [Lysobacter niabensis]|uniref:Uncharacterized protein n=1 Tax=Agrilutibacter niabensis TaxID=380628 RepID=A0ABU1VTA4_9GAMM|nr:hypothetical protein [Lysobacter niabensis]MDR7100717.1 hypothetical protein [Lysobacter niabensis]